jgi:hypothetical protein
MFFPGDDEPFVSLFIRNSPLAKFPAHTNHLQATLEKDTHSTAAVHAYAGAGA